MQPMSKHLRSPIRDRIVRALHYRLTRNGVDMMYVAGGSNYCNSIAAAMRLGSMTLNGFEASAIMHFVRSTSALSGSIAELGVFRGGSSHLICEIKGEKALHLFDTFDGLPELTARDGRHSIFSKGQFVSSLEQVRQYVSGFPNVHFHPGIFPETAVSISDERFSFVHLDADLYESTKTALEFFYPRMVQQGVILSHDCFAPGVAQAFTEFFTSKPENVFYQPAGSQCFVVKA